jgi:hypothetical protein
VAKLLIVAGLALTLVGVLVHYGVPLGRLPGDIVVRRGSSTFYFPVATCVVVSVVLTLLVSLLRR